MTALHTYEVHGGLNDGLRLYSQGTHSFVLVPMDRVLDSDGYQAWEPVPGDLVGIYVYDGKPRDDPERPGVTVRHMYLQRVHTMIDHPECTCLPAWLPRAAEIPAHLHRPECPRWHLG